MNFALILLVLVVLTGIAWVFDKLVFLPKRRRDADAAVATIREHRGLIHKLNFSRIDHELVAPYFGPE